MDANEEKSRLLFQLPVPVSFRCLGTGCDAIEYSTEVDRIFQNGFVISSPRVLKVGSSLALKLRLPPEGSGGFYHYMRCAGRVVQKQFVKDGTFGYKVEIESCTLPVEEATSLPLWLHRRNRLSSR